MPTKYLTPTNPTADIAKLQQGAYLNELVGDRPKLSYGTPSTGSAPEGKPVPMGAPSNIASAPGMDRAARPALRYDGALPEMEAEPTAPQFAPRKVGVGGRLLSALTGMGMAANAARGADPTAQGFNAIGGLIGGLINPAAVQRQQFEAGPMAEYRQKTATVRAGNQRRLEDFTKRTQAAKAVAELEQVGQTKLQPYPGAASATLYNPQTGEITQPQVNGKAVPMASVLNNELDENTRRDLAKMKAENDAAKAETAFERQLRLQREKEAAAVRLKLQDMENRVKILSEQGKQKMGQLKFQEGQRNRRQTVTEAGKDKRAANAGRPALKVE